MQVFMPTNYLSINAKILDNKRLNKQLVEIKQIIAYCRMHNKILDEHGITGKDYFINYSIANKNKKEIIWHMHKYPILQIDNKIYKITSGHFNHPIVYIWRFHVEALKNYFNSLLKEAINRKINTSYDMYRVNYDNFSCNDIISNELYLRNHIENLLHKDYNFYAKKVEMYAQYFIHPEKINANYKHENCYTVEELNYLYNEKGRQ